jgi:hypothetical protein
MQPGFNLVAVVGSFARSDDRNLLESRLLSPGCGRRLRSRDALRFSQPGL